MAKQISSLSVLLSANVGKFGTDMQSAGNDVKKFSSTVEKSGSALGEMAAEAAGAVVPVVALAAAFVATSVAAVKLAAPYEAAQVQLDALCGSTQIATSLLEDLRKFSIKSPFAFPELLDTSKRLIAVGVNAQAIPKILEEAGQVAVGTGKPIGEIGDILARVAGEGRVTSRELRELGPVTQQLAKQFHTSTAGVRELADSGQIGFLQVEKALDSLTSKGGKFSGIMEAQANTVGGKFHSLTASIEDDSARISEKFLKAFHVGPIIDIVTKAVGTLDVYLEDFLDRIADLEGVNPPKIPDPDPVKITSILDPATQNLEIKPVILPAAMRAGSAEAQAARYASAARGVASASTPGFSLPSVVTSVPPTSPASVLPPSKAPWHMHDSNGSLWTRDANGSERKQDKDPYWGDGMAHAPNSDFRKKFGYAGTVTELSDAIRKPDGNWQVKSTHGGISGALTPEQFDNLKSYGQGNKNYSAYNISPAEQAKLDSVYGKRDYHAEAVAGSKMSLSDRWETNHGGIPRDSITQRKRDLENAGLAQPGGSGPLAAPRAVSDSAEKNQSTKIDTSNTFLDRIERNTRASGTGATIINF